MCERLCVSVCVCMVVFVRDLVGSFTRVLVRERGYVCNCVTKIVWSNPLRYYWELMGRSLIRKVRGGVKP